MIDHTKPVRHILALSGGKDSAALAVYLRNKIPNLEYVFLDTGHELPETYEYLQRIKAILGIDIVTLRSNRTFEHWLKIKQYFLPSPRQRWCTELLKIRPYEQYIGTEQVQSYIGIRADEDRDGYISHKPNIIPRYPFIEDELVYEDVEYLLESSGLGLPNYYRWRSRSGCYFCFFQQKIEWHNLAREHPDLFRKAASFEKIDPLTGRRYSWNEGVSLEQILEANPASLQTDASQSKAPVKSSRNRRTRLVETLNDHKPCVICSV